MSLNCYINYPPNFKAESSTAPLAKPIKIVQKHAEKVADTFTPEIKDSKKKKVRNTAIAAGSSALVLGGVVALLNPKYSSRFIEKLKFMRGMGGKKFWNGTIKTLEFSNNVNSMKDIGFKRLCNKAKILKKPHEAITKWFDKIGQKTVIDKYKNVSKKMDNFETLLKQYGEKLPADKKAAFETKLAQIQEARKFLSKENTYQRLLEQEKLMSNLEKDFTAKFNEYRSGFKNGNHQKHFSENMYFWAQEIMRPTRDIVEKGGEERVSKLFGRNGVYDDISEILKPYLKSEEKTILDKKLGKLSQRLHKANYSECVEYFDKKRDLILGSAPTDIVTALLSLGLSGLAISVADNKEDRISRLLTGVFPVVAGLGASMIFTAKLYSGIKGLLYGFGTSAALSAVGSAANHFLIKNPNNTQKEVIHA